MQKKQNTQLFSTANETMKEGFPFCVFLDFGDLFCCFVLLSFLRRGFRFDRECFGDGQHEKLAARFFMALGLIKTMNATSAVFHLLMWHFCLIMLDA